MKKFTILAILCLALLFAGCVPQEEAKEHTHTLTHTEGYPATCLDNGITENWFCLDCGKRFADAEAAKEITFADIEIIAPGHTSAEDDGDCTTAINCTVCGEIATPAKAHTPEEDDGTCLTAQNCTVCDQIAIPAKDEHVATISPANCVNIALCDYCETPFGELDPTNHRDNETKIRYADENTHETYYECCNTVVETGTHNGEATCSSYGYCTICATGYAEPDPTNHKSDETYTIGIDGEKHGVYYSCCQTLKEEVEHTVDKPATCNQRASCADCGNEFGEFNPENHAIPEARINWINGEYHEERYICCDTLVKTEAHNGEATCMHVAYCTVCEQNYGNYDITNHESDEFIYEPAGPGAHTKFHACCRTVSVLTEACSGGTATCTEKAVCTACGTAYVNPDNHEYEKNNGICCETYQPAELNESGYYEIGNAGQLFWFAQQVNVEGNKEIKGVLTAAIDLENKPWTPIGAMGEENSFRGVFDGQNYTIWGLNVEGSENGVGFFGEVRTGTIKNFTIYGEVVVNTEVDYVGGVIGSICGLNSTDHGLERNGAIIQNITSFVNVTVKANGVGMIGGFVGYADHQSLIEQCAWYGTFDAGIYRVDSGAGGFIGKIQENTSEVTIRNCAAYGTIKTDYAKNSFNDYPTIYMGGFLSFSNTGAETTLENCLFAGKFERGENLTDEAHLGAFGTLRSVKAIKNCYYLGDDGLEAVHSDSPLKPGDNIEITSVTEDDLRNGTIATQLGDFWEQGEHYPVIKK